MFTFYWAVWLFTLAIEENGNRNYSLPYEIIFATFISVSMIGTYVTQWMVSEYKLNREILLQASLIGSAGALGCGSMIQTSSLAFFMCLVSKSVSQLVY